MSANRTGIIAAFVLTALCTRFAFCGPEAGKNPYPTDWFWGEPDQRAKLDEMIGQPMPAVEATNWVNGAVTSENLKGKIVVVDIWATWCGPCLGSIPHNNEMLVKYKDKGVAIVALCSSSRGQDKMEAVAKEKGINYPTGQDKDLKMQKAWRLMWYPTYAVVDRDGLIRCIGLQPENVEKVVEKLLEEQPAKSAAAR